jgi:hypothetical protein
MRAGMPPKPVYVLSPEPMTSFYTNLDNNLRQSMRHIGYNLSDSPHDAYVFTYDAMPISPISDMANNVQLTLRVFTGVGENAKQLTEETGQFFVQGAEKLSITPARYMGLPTMMATPPQPQQMVAPAAVEAIPAPMAMTPSIPAPEVTTTMQRQRVSDPVVMTPARAPVVRAPLPDVPMPKIQSNASQQSPAIIAPSLSVPAVATPKAEVGVPQAALDFESPQYTVQLEQEVVEPSRDDIVIINRDVETPDFDEGMALSGAQSVPQSTKDLVRGRVSNPADY